MLNKTEFSNLKQRKHKTQIRKITNERRKFMVSFQRCLIYQSCKYHFNRCICRLFEIAHKINCRIEKCIIVCKMLSIFKCCSIILTEFYLFNECKFFYESRIRRQWTKRQPETKTIEKEWEKWAYWIRNVMTVANNAFRYSGACLKLACVLS